MADTETRAKPSFALFSGEPQYEAFARMDELFPIREMAAATQPHDFPSTTTIALPERYSFNDAERSTEAFIVETDTSALLVVKDGTVRFERYRLTGGRDVRWISWSVAKSFVSALVGIAIEDGLIDAIDDPITRYVPGLSACAYDQVSIKDVLQMSSGARWNEDYSDPDADVHQLAQAMSGAKSLNAFVAGMQRATKPGTVCQYNSADTQALGMLLVEVTGRAVARYMQEKLCEPLGFEAEGFWILDGAGMELVLGGLNLTARDYAKIGELYRNGGVWNGQQIVPEAWVAASIKPDARHLEAGKVLVGGHVLPLGYGYQWWVPPGDCGEFSAIGIYNQFVYVDPSRGVVIVKLSANPFYGTSPNESENRELETIELFRAIARVA